MNKLSEWSSTGKIITYTRYYIAYYSLTIHPSYFSYLILIYLSYAYFSLKKLNPLNYFHLIFILFCSITLLLLQSRAALVTLFFLLFYGIIKLFYQRRYIQFTLLFIIIVSGGVFAYKYTRLGETIKHISVSENNNQTDSRLIIWKNALTTIKQKPIFGYGVGDALDVLIEEHKRTGFEEGVEKRLDAHNQFLETWLQSGVFGLISLLLVFAIPLYQSIKKKQELLFLFLMISFIQLLFESMFIRLAGVVYFSFFYSYLYYVYYAEGGEWENISSPINN